MKTTQKVLEDIYDEQVEAMRLALKTHNAGQGDIGAATLNVIRQFLKDAGIQAKPTRGSALGNLAASLPTFGDDADDLPISPSN